MLTTTLAFLVSTAAALELTSDVPITEGATVTITVSGAVSGERVWIMLGESGVTCPQAIDPACLDLQNMKAFRKYVAGNSDYQTTFVVPPGAEELLLQAASPSAVSGTIGYDVTVQPGGPSLLFTGVLASCATDQADLLAEYIGHADQMVATAFLNGVAVGSNEMDLLDGGPGAVFLWAEANGVPAPSCADLTWSYEASSTTDQACIVQGDEEDTLISDGMVPAHCSAW